MKKKKLPDPILLCLRVKCSCGETHTIEKPMASFHGCEDECEMCGTHGRVWMNFSCPTCKEYQKIELESW